MRGTSCATRKRIPPCRCKMSFTYDNEVPRQNDYAAAVFCKFYAARRPHGPGAGISSQLILGHAFVVPCARYVTDIQPPLLKKDRERIGGQGRRDSLRRFSNRPSRGRWSTGRFFPDSWLFPSLKAVEIRIFRSAKTHCSAHNRQRVPSPNRRKRPGSPRSPPAGQPEAPPTHR